MTSIGIKKPVLWVLLIISFISRPTEAVTRRVPSEYPTIQQAIDASSAGDLVLVAPGTYTDFETRILDGFAWSSCAFLKNEVTVRSEQGPDVTTIDLVELMGPQRVGIIAYKLPSTMTSLDGFRVQGVGPGPLAIVAFQCGNFMLQNCVILNYDRGPTVGGAMIVEGPTSITNCEFANCKAYFGGALYQADGHLEIIGTTFRECGHVALFSDDSGGLQTSVYLADCAFIDNWNTNGGTGGGAAIGAPNITVTGCLFRGNVNTVQSGAGLAAIGTHVAIEGCIFIENESSNFGGRGGGLHAWGFPLLMIRHNTFVENRASLGAAVDMSYGILENNIVVGSRDGTAIIADLGGLDSNCNVFWDNPEGIGYPLAPTDREINPLFCDQGALDLTLRKGSPCLPEDPLGCGLIGALGQGCGTISVDSKSWGSIKGLYR